MASTDIGQDATRLRTTGLFVDRRVRALQDGYLKNRSAAVAALARLRRAAGKEPGVVADVLEYTLAPELAVGAGDDPTPQERAAHIALTLYALHQQSQPHRMHRAGAGLGAAVRKLHPDEPKSPPHPVLRRFQTLGTADSLAELVHHTRGMVQLLRAGQVPLDYGLLADQLVRWQDPKRRPAVRMTWGRDFYRLPKTD